MMKKSNRLFSFCLIIVLYLFLTGCKAQETEEKVINTDLPGTSDARQSMTTPSINQAGPTTVQQATQDLSTPAVNPTDTGVTSESPNSSLYLPTLFNNAQPESYTRPPDAQGEDLPPERWQEWPVIPVISDRALEIYRAGIAHGHDPTHFSKIGDCQNIHQYFLGLFDSTGTYRLGDQYEYLQETINYFSGSWSRSSEAVRTGFNVASVLAPLQADPQMCLPAEAPMTCEIRLWNPSFVIISMETWTPERPLEAYENYLRMIVEYAISQNVLPVLATKADNLEGNNAINQIVANLAAEYDIPLWNFWAATQPTTNQGMEEDRFHLTNGPNYYDDPKSLDLGWPIRNLTGLLTVDAVWKAVR